MEVYRPEDAFTINLRTFKLFGAWPSAVENPTLRFYIRESKFIKSLLLFLKENFFIRAKYFLLLLVFLL